MKSIFKQLEDLEVSTIPEEVAIKRECLEAVAFLLEQDDGFEYAVRFSKECIQMLTEGKMPNHYNWLDQAYRLFSSQ